MSYACRRRTLAALLFAGTLAAGAAPTHAVVQARSAWDAPPRVTAQVHGKRSHPPGAVGVLPLGDAPRAPGTGQVVGEFLCSALSSRGTGCIPLAPPADATGEPLAGAGVDDTRLAAAGRDAGVAVAITGRVTLLDVEADWRPNLTVWRRGAFVDIPAGGIVRTNLAFQFRTVDVATGKLLCAVQVQHGPGERLPEPALAEATDAALTACFGAAP